MEGVEKRTYPSAISSLIPALHDTDYYHRILENECNFAKETLCDVFEVHGNVGHWKTYLDLFELKQCLQAPCKPKLRAM
jgi:hypothetical protein